MFWNKRVYLDYAASVPPTRAALRAHAGALNLVGNPSSPHEEGRKAKEILEDARTRIARLLSVKSDDIIFTSGATEANNLAIESTVRNAKRAANGGGVHVLYLPSSHASVVKTLNALTEWGVEAEPLVITNGEVDVTALATQLRPETALVVMDMVCGETGTVWNTRDVSLALLSSRVPLLVDASQAPLTELMERMRIGGHMITLDAQKVGGVRGIGLLVAARTLGLTAVTHGGGQERELRPGTENVAGAIAFAAALEEAQEKREARVKEWSGMRTDLIKNIESIPGVAINEGKKQSPRILNMSLPGRDTDYLVALLDKAGFAVSTKSACESDSSEGSRAVMALTNDIERAKATLRISWGPDTTTNDLTTFSHALRAAVVFLDAR